MLNKIVHWIGDRQRSIGWLISGVVGIFLVISLSIAQEKADQKQEELKSKSVYLLEIVGAIGPSIQDYIQRGIEKAAKENAGLIIIKLDTPGGLETSMRGINRSILASPLPIAAFVAPSGARAASAGTYIVYASHIAAMAPGTNIGAATPINIGGEHENPSTTTPKSSNPTSNLDIEPKSTSEQKATHDSAAYIRSLAELRGRNALWAEEAVRKAVSLSAEEAYKLKVIDLIANDVPDLLKKIQGRKVNIQGQSMSLNLDPNTLIEFNPDWRFKILSILTDPTIAYILLLIGIYGLFFEFTSPGMVVPGIAGAIALLLALYAFQLLPINFAGFALLTLGIAFMIAEIYLASFGALGIGGLIAFVAGSLLLLDTGEEGFNIAWQMIALMSLISAAFFLVVMSLAIRSQRRKIETGHEALLGSIGVVLEQGSSPPEANAKVMIRILGEIWQARSPWPLHSGQRVKVVKIRGLELEVQPLDKPPS